MDRNYILFCISDKFPPIIDRDYWLDSRIYLIPDSLIDENRAYLQLYHHRTEELDLDLKITGTCLTNPQYDQVLAAFIWWWRYESKRVQNSHIVRLQFHFIGGYLTKIKVIKVEYLRTFRPSQCTVFREVGKYSLYMEKILT